MTPPQRLRSVEIYEAASATVLYRYRCVERLSDQAVAIAQCDFVSETDTSQDLQDQQTYFTQNLVSNWDSLEFHASLDAAIRAFRLAFD